MNVEKLLQVKRTILRDPGSQFVMDSFFADAESIDSSSIEIKRKKVANCGTAACIAGTAIAMEMFQNNRQEARRNRGAYAPFDTAKKILDLNETQAEKLFYLVFQAPTLNPNREWPPQFRDAYLAAKTLKARKRIAAKRIDHFIKTNGQE